MGRVLLVLVVLLVSGCGIGSDRAPPARPAYTRPNPATPPADGETRACLADLRRADIDYSPLPDQYFGGGCAISG